jgi:hypothetical protein
MIIVRTAKFGCSDHYAKGNCANGTMVQEEKIERSLLGEIKRQVLTPNVVDYVVEALATAPPADDSRKRLATVESELTRLADAVAATGPTPALVAAIKQREVERQNLSRKPAQPLSDLRAWVQSRLSDIQALLHRDLARARAQLARHAGTLGLMPTPAGYQVSGTWDLLGSGEYIAGGCSQAHPPPIRGERRAKALPEPSFCFILVSSASGRAKSRAASRPTFHLPTKSFPKRFLSVPARGDEDSPEACFIMGRQESAAGISSPGTAATVSEILGYWKRSAAVGDGCIEISAHSSEVELK